MEITIYRSSVSIPPNQSWPMPVCLFEQELDDFDNPTVLTTVEAPEGSRFVWEIDPEDDDDEEPEPEWFIALPDGERVNAEMLLRKFAAPEVVRSVDAAKMLSLDSFSPDVDSN